MKNQTKIYVNGQWTYLQEGKPKKEIKGVILFWISFLVVFLLFVFGLGIMEAFLFPALGI